MKVMVTGGGGFLGGGIVKALLKKGHSVRSLARSCYPLLEESGVEQIRGDLSDMNAVLQAAEGCELVFHVAAKAGVWGSYESYYQANVTGTENVIQACRNLKINRLVYTSSPSVVFGGEDQENVNESAHYPKQFLTNYPKTKAIAEKLVNEANHGQLATVSLRPHLIWGPGDNHLLPRIVARAKAGKLRLVGSQNKLVDSVYIDNAVDAHILAAERLGPSSPIAGKNYFITNDQPMTMAQLINGLLRAAGQPAVERRIPGGLAYAAGTIFEGIYHLLGIQEEPPITRFVARQLTTAHWFDLSAAKQDLGYIPKVSMEEGFRRLETALKKADSLT